MAQEIRTRLLQSPCSELRAGIIPNVEQKTLIRTSCFHFGNNCFLVQFALGVPPFSRESAKDSRFAEGFQSSPRHYRFCKAKSRPCVQMRTAFVALSSPFRNYFLRKVHLCAALSIFPARCSRSLNTSPSLARSSYCRYKKCLGKSPKNYSFSAVVMPKSR